MHGGYLDGSDGGGRVACEFAVINVPFSGDGGLLKVQPSQFDFNPPRAEIAEHNIRIKIAMIGMQGPDLKQRVESELSKLRTYVDRQRSDIDGFNHSLPQEVRSKIEARRKHVLEKHGILASVGIPIKRRQDRSLTYAPDVRRKIAPVRPPASNAPFGPEPSISMEIYEDILGVLQRMAEVLERSPSSFSKMGEEDLRTHFIVQLNGQFEIGATAESFNAGGKSDIFLPFEGGNVFIAECKIWSGEKDFKLIFDQLFGYVTWRDTKTAILVFSRNKNFSDVLTKAEQSGKEHPNFKRVMQYEPANGFRAAYGHPSDPNREVIVTTVIFDVPA